MRKLIVLTFLTLDGVMQAPTIPAAFTLVESKALPNGVIITNYKRAGEIKTGSF